MSDSYSDPQKNGRNFEGSREGGRGSFRGGRGPGNRETGGFRIRLSDNEMRSARALQEAFNLRSTVAVLGFALRTLGQMLEEGKLDELVAQHRAQTSRGGTRREDDGSRKNRLDGDKQGSSRGSKPNPFARPEKPQPKASKEEDLNESESGKEASSDQQSQEGAGEEIPAVTSTESTTTDSEQSEENKTAEDTESSSSIES